MLRACGKDLEIFGTPTFIAPNNIEMGDSITLNDKCLLNATESLIKLGNNITISNDAKIIAATLDIKDFIPKKHKHHIKKNINIGDNTWICAGAIILPGVTIIGNCVIAAGAVLTKDVLEQNVVVAGNPAKVVKYIK